MVPSKRDVCRRAPGKDSRWSSVKLPKQVVLVVADETDQEVFLGKETGIPFRVLKQKKT